MITAIYARKSTEQNGVADDAKSVARQIANAREYAARKQWTVRDEHIYQDDGVSGVLFGPSRPGLARLLNSLKPRPPFQILVMSEQSRLGREQIETGYVLKQIIDAGVRVFFYADDREAVLDDPVQKMMLSLANFAAEMERDKARQRTHGTGWQAPARRPHSQCRTGSSRAPCVSDVRGRSWSRKDRQDIER